MTEKESVLQVLENMALTDAESAVALDLLCRISVSIERHLTPAVQVRLSLAGITRKEAIEHLARRALEGIIEHGARSAA